MIPAASGGSRRMQRVLEPALIHAAAWPDADRYRKHFTTEAHLRILCYHALSGSPSLRQTHNTLAAQGWERVGLTKPISRSQLARSSTSRPTEPLALLFAQLVKRAQPRSRRTRPAAEHTLFTAIDSTFLELSAALSPWSLHGGHAPGVRVHVDFALAAAIPTQIRLTLADTHDRRALDEADLDAYAGWTVLIDRGYYAHHLFTRLLAAGADFIVPHHPQAMVRWRPTTRSQPVPLPPETSSWPITP